jgi:cobalt/nickel transport system permease protein
MHMADALISTAVGGVTIAAAVGITAYSNSKIKDDLSKDKVPLMGVMGAFVFAAQMINFTIPGTGSSGHLTGGLMLAATLGPHAGFLAICAILLIQALFFADGGLLALGCNIINMGFFACFIAYPLIFKPIVKKVMSARRIITGSVLAAVAALQMGAFAVVLETLLSGKTQLPFVPFTALMLPIHLAIGLVEGLITAAILVFIWKAQPEIMEPSLPRPHAPRSGKRVLAILAALTLVLAGGLFWLASSHPDGLEWSVGRALTGGELTASELGNTMGEVQQRTSLFADYGSENGTQSFAGVVGAILTLGLIVAAAVAIRLYGRKKSKAPPVQKG